MDGLQSAQDTNSRSSHCEPQASPRSAQFDPQHWHLSPLTALETGSPNRHMSYPASSEWIALPVNISSSSRYNRADATGMLLSLNNVIFEPPATRNFEDFNCRMAISSVTSHGRAAGEILMHPKLPQVEKMDFRDHDDLLPHLGSSAYRDGSDDRCGPQPAAISFNHDDGSWSRIPPSTEFLPMANDTTFTRYPSSEDVDHTNDSTAASESSSTTGERVKKKKKKKSKMHTCEICNKMFPRPSGLRTHMNTHNNVKPFPCEFQGCTRTFTVRSNAKRHLRTHGVENTSASFRTPTSTPYVVDFDEPKVLAPNAAGTKELPPKLRWLPPSLSSRTNASLLVSLSDDDSSDDEDGLRQDHPWRVFNLPCSPVVPTTPERGLQERFEERDSYKVAPLYPYHPSQFRVLPGPAVQPSIAA